MSLAAPAQVAEEASPLAVLLLGAAREARPLRAVLKACPRRLELEWIEDPERARAELAKRDARWALVIAAGTSEMEVLAAAPPSVSRALVCDGLSPENLRAAQRLGATLCTMEGAPEQCALLLEHAARMARERERQRGREDFDAEQVRILELVACSAPLEHVLGRIVLLIERFGAGVCSILLVDAATGLIRHGAAPNLPSSFVRAVDGQQIGPKAGSCGTAAYLKQQVFVRDIATHPYWEDWRHLALPLGLVACWSSPIYAADGAVLGTFAVYYRTARDPSELELRQVASATHLASLAITRNRNERALRASEERQRRLIETSYEGVLLLDSNGCITFANQRAATMLGFTPTQLVGEAFGSLARGSELDQLLAPLGAAKASKSAQYELCLRTSHGRDLWVIAAASPLLGDDGEPTGTLTMLTDITERKRSEQEVADKERLLALIYQSVSDVICYLTVEPNERYRLLSVNRAFCDALGVEESQVIGKDIDEVVTMVSDESLKSHYRAAIEGRRSVRWDEVGRFPGRTEYAEAVATPIFDERGVCTHLIVTSRLITERKQAEAKIAQQAALLDRARDAITVRTLDHVVEYWNEGATRLYGYTREEALGRSALELQYRDRRAFDAAMERLLETGAFAGELEACAKDGSEVTVDSRWTLLRDECGKPESVLAMSIDASERKRLDAQLMMAQRMDALGTLAGGIAHDFNNILAAIRGYLELAIGTLPRDAEAARMLEVVRSATDRAVQLVKQILTFSRHQPTHREPCALQPIVEEVLQLLRATLPRMLELEAEFSPGAFDVLADATQLHQVIMNLGTNAAQASRERGKVVVRLAPVTLSRPLIGVASEIPPGAYMRLTIADEGSGIDAAMLGRIFDPFFTTKGPGGGTGLGLSVALGIVKAHGGALTVSSVVGEGTSFDIYLPAAAAVRATSRPPILEESLRGHGERILCVDDEEWLLALEKTYLEDLGYVVDAFQNPREALRAFEAQPLAYAALVSDLSMPDMSGIELAQNVHGARPELPIVLSSGHLPREQREQARRAGVRAMVAKPDFLEPLARALMRFFRASHVGSDAPG